MDTLVASTVSFVEEFSLRLILANGNGMASCRGKGGVHDAEERRAEEAAADRRNLSFQASLASTPPYSVKLSGRYTL